MSSQAWKRQGLAAGDGSAPLSAAHMLLRPNVSLEQVSCVLCGSCSCMDFARSQTPFLSTRYRLYLSLPQHSEGSPQPHKLLQASEALVQMAD